MSQFNLIGFLICRMKNHISSGNGIYGLTAIHINNASKLSKAKLFRSRVH